MKFPKTQPGYPVNFGRLVILIFTVLEENFENRYKVSELSLKFLPLILYMKRIIESVTSSLNYSATEG